MDLTVNLMSILTLVGWALSLVVLVVTMRAQIQQLKDRLTIAEVSGADREVRLRHVESTHSRFDEKLNGIERLLLRIEAAIRPPT